MLLHNPPIHHLLGAGSTYLIFLWIFLSQAVGSQQIYHKLYVKFISRSPAVARFADRTGYQWPSRSSKVNDLHFFWKGVCDFPPFPIYGHIRCKLKEMQTRAISRVITFSLHMHTVCSGFWHKYDEMFCNILQMFASHKNHTGFQGRCHLHFAVTWDVSQIGSTRFYARQQNASRVLAIVWASVRPSVTLVICIKTVQARITKSSLWLPQGL